MASQNSDPPKPDDTTTADDDREAGRIRSLDERFKSIEDKQDRQQSTLERILDVLPGGHAGDDDQGAEPAAAAEPGQRSGGIGAEVRRQIAEADERRKAEEADAGWRKGIEDAIEALKPERAPREPQAGARGRLQRILFGKPE